MNAPRLDELPTEFPIFPLSGALLLPHGKLPLNVFERRYLAMIEDALSAGRVIGMIQPDELRPATPSGPALYKVGCLGRLSSFSETDDGRVLVTLTGVIRFAVKVELELHRGYRRVRGDLARFRTDLEADPAPPDDIAAEAALIPPGALACLIYTSGTGGAPRNAFYDEKGESKLSATALCLRLARLPLPPDVGRAIVSSKHLDRTGDEVLGGKPVEERAHANGVRLVVAVIEPPIEVVAEGVAKLEARVVHSELALEAVEHVFRKSGTPK